MRFNSVKGSDYSSGARAVNRNSDAAFDASRKSSFDFTKTSKAAINARSTERQAAMKGQGLKDVTQIKADTLVEGTQLKVDTDKAVSDIKRPAKRMAGVVAGLGALSTGAINMKEAREAKAERATLKLERDKITALQQTQQADSKAWRAKIEGLLTKQLDGSDPDAPSTSTSASTSTSTSTSTSQPLSSNDAGKDNWGGLQHVIRSVEGTLGDKGYTTRFGGAQFKDLSQHPNIGAPTPWGTTSEAAGAFQFMKPTWDEAATELGLTDFSRESQQKAGRFLTQRRGVDPDQRFTTFEDFTSAISKLSPEWAGLPNTTSGRSGYHGQANTSMQEAWSMYQDYFK